MSEVEEEPASVPEFRLYLLPGKRRLEPGVPCSPGCQGHVTHPCEKCGRYGAGLGEMRRDLEDNDGD